MLEFIDLFDTRLQVQWLLHWHLDYCSFPLPTTSLGDDYREKGQNQNQYFLYTCTSSVSRVSYLFHAFSFIYWYSKQMILLCPRGVVCWKQQFGPSHDPVFVTIHGQVVCVGNLSTIWFLRLAGSVREALVWHIITIHMQGSTTLCILFT